MGLQRRKAFGLRDMGGLDNGRSIGGQANSASTKPRVAGVLGNICSGSIRSLDRKPARAHRCERCTRNSRVLEIERINSAYGSVFPQSCFLKQPHASEDRLGNEPT